MTALELSPGWLDMSLQLQAGLGRPANYKKEAVVAAALGLRDLGRRTIYKKEQL
ncbi:MAG: hypothetical protein R6U62_09000 [Bacteroidales bacterium]